MLIPADPDATRVEFQVPGVGLVAVLADGVVEHPVVVGETLHEPDGGEPYVETHVELRTDPAGKVLADAPTVVAELVQKGVLRVADDSKKTAKPSGPASTTEKED